MKSCNDKLIFKKYCMEYVGCEGKYKLDFNFLCISKAVQPVLSTISLKPIYISNISNIKLRIDMYLKVLAIIVIILLLSSCANMNESDCLTADWNLIGFEDGSFGKNETHISQHRQECSEHGVTPNLSAYRQGHYEGSKRFCTQSNGFSQSQKGKGYNRNCPTELEVTFLIGFTDGQTLYGLKKVLQQHTRSLENTYSKIESLDTEVAKKSDLMLADGLEREQRIAIRDEIEDHQQEQAELYDLLPELKQEFENSLQAYEQALHGFSNYL
jgi:hypothetical protein